MKSFLSKERSIIIFDVFSDERRPLKSDATKFKIENSLSLGELEAGMHKISNATFERIGNA